MTFACRVLDRQIRAELSLLDDGLSVLLAGGDKSHIGAVPVAEPDGRTQTVDFPGHREREVAKQWAAVLAQICGCRTAVVCGIHYDGLAREGLLCVLKALDGLLHDVIRYVNETVGPVPPRSV